MDINKKKMEIIGILEINNGISVQPNAPLKKRIK